MSDEGSMTDHAVADAPPLSIQQERAMYGTYKACEQSFADASLSVSRLSDISTEEELAMLDQLR